MSKQQTAIAGTAVNEQDFREGIMPRAQLSKAACDIALQKTTRQSIHQFAGWELMEANMVIRVLEDAGTTKNPLSPDANAFLKKLESLDGLAFENEYMAAELSNHEWLRDFAQSFIAGYDDAITGKQEIGHVAALALFAFTEHVGLCRNIIKEINA